MRIVRLGLTVSVVEGLQEQLFSVLKCRDMHLSWVRKVLPLKCYNERVEDGTASAEWPLLAWNAFTYSDCISLHSRALDVRGPKRTSFSWTASSPCCTARSATPAMMCHPTSTLDPSLLTRDVSLFPLWATKGVSTSKPGILTEAV